MFLQLCDHDAGILQCLHDKMLNLFKYDYKKMEFNDMLTFTCVSSHTQLVLSWQGKEAYN